jgi:hypothetical protein
MAGKLTVITTVDKKTELNQLIDELRVECLKKLDEGNTEEDTALGVIAVVVHEWIIESLMMAANFDDDKGQGSIN